MVKEKKIYIIMSPGFQTFHVRFPLRRGERGLEPRLVITEGDNWRIDMKNKLTNVTRNKIADIVFDSKIQRVFICFGAEGTWSRAAAGSLDRIYISPDTWKSKREAILLLFTTYPAKHSPAL